MNDTNPFILFGTAHLVTLAVILAVAIALPVLARRRLTAARQYHVGLFLGCSLIVQEAFLIWLRTSHYGLHWTEVLPLHLCGLAVFVTAWALIAQSYRAYEVVYFWAWGGTLQALITPDLELGFPEPAYLAFFVAHGLVVVGVVYLTFTYRYRPYLRSIFRSIAALLVAVAVIAPINVWLGTNYLFLRAKPEQASLMDYLGPWPWYILALVGIGLVSCFVYYLPFLIKDWLAGRRLSGSENP